MTDDLVQLEGETLSRKVNCDQLDNVNFECVFNFSSYGVTPHAIIVVVKKLKLLFASYEVPDAYNNRHAKCCL